MGRQSDYRVAYSPDYKYVYYTTGGPEPEAFRVDWRITTQQKGAVRIDELARHAGLGLRQYERRFADETGMTPKLFSRITRFQAALDAKRLGRQRSWLSIAHEFGYCDQMHMVRDFRNLSGEVPGQILLQSGDLQPWSVVSPMEVLN